MTNAAEIGRNIVLLRKAKNISQERLALRAEMSVSFLRDIEHGQANPSLDSLERLADILGVDVWVFMLLSKNDGSILDTLHELRRKLKTAVGKAGVM